MNILHNVCRCNSQREAPSRGPLLRFAFKCHRTWERERLLFRRRKIIPCKGLKCFTCLWRKTGANEKVCRRPFLKSGARVGAFVCGICKKTAFVFLLLKQKSFFVLCILGLLRTALVSCIKKSSSKSLAWAKPGFGQACVKVIANPKERREWRNQICSTKTLRNSFFYGTTDTFPGLRPLLLEGCAIKDI